MYQLRRISLRLNKAIPVTGGIRVVNTWFSGTNAVLTDQCQALGDVTVNLAVTEDLVTEGNDGFSLQLNAYPMPGATSVGLALNWIQFTIYVSNTYGSNTAAFQWQAWALGATQWPEGQPPGTTNPNQPVPPFHQPNPQITNVPSNQLLKGSSLTIALTTDPSSHGVTAAKFSVQLAGATERSVTLTFPGDAQFPIGGFQVNLVGPGNLAQALFTSGAGELTYSVSPGSLSVQNGGVGTACGQYPGALTGETSNVVYDAVTPSTGATLSQPLHVAAPMMSRGFQTVDDYAHIFVLGADGNLWFARPPFGTAPPARDQVDATVLNFQAFDNDLVFVLGTDGKLWCEHAPFGAVPPTRQQVDGEVQAFQVIDQDTVLVLGNDGNLWLETAPFGPKVPPARTQVDGNVKAFYAPNENMIFVLGNDGNLWLEEAPFGPLPPTRQQVDSKVSDFYGLTAYEWVWVIRNDATLWLESYPYGAPDSVRQQIDSNVVAAQPVELDQILVLDTSLNLWLESAPFGTIPPPNKAQIDGNVMEFAATDASNVLVLGSDGNLWWEKAPFGANVPPVRSLIDGDVA